MTKTKKRLNVYAIDFEIAVRDANAVIRAAKKIMSSTDWKARVAEEDGDELFVAVSTLFNSTYLIPDHLVDAIDFLASGCVPDGTIASDWSSTSNNENIQRAIAKGRF